MAVANFDVAAVEQQPKRLKPLPAAKSKVWKYFGFQTDEHGAMKMEEAFCQLCDGAIRYSKNTTNLQLHLKRHHPVQYAEIAPEARVTGDEASTTKHCKQMSLAACCTKVEPYLKSSRRYQACENALVSFVCLDLQPVSVVSSQAFQILSIHWTRSTNQPAVTNSAE